MRVLILLLAFAGAVHGQFRFRDQSPTSIELSENGSPVFVYNHGMMLRDGVPADRKRCCYLHPVYAPNGVVDRKSTRLNSSHIQKSRMPSSA